MLTKLLPEKREETFPSDEREGKAEDDDEEEAEGEEQTISGREQND